MAHQRWPCKGWGWEWAWLIAVVGAWRIACIGWPCKSVTETRLRVLKLLLLSMWVPSQVYVCLIQLTIFAQVCCVRNVNGEMWPFQLPKGPWVPPFKVFFNRESVRTRDFTKWTPHLHIGLCKLARHDKTKKKPPFQKSKILWTANQMHHCLYEDNFVVYLAHNEGANRILSDVFNQVRVTHKDNGAGPITHDNSHKGFFSVLNTQQTRVSTNSILPFPLDLL